jgi:hypothetical protein
MESAPNNPDHLDHYRPGSVGARSRSESGSGGAGLLDVLDRALDKGVVIAGDIRINLLDIELLTIKIRLLISSADKAKEMGIDWWTRDPHLSSKAQDQQGKQVDSKRENKALRERVEKLEAQLKAITQQEPPGSPQQQPNGSGAGGHRLPHSSGATARRG